MSNIWFITFTGIKFDLLNPTAEMIDIRDIAHALAYTCRFGGHVKRYYSVAEHCFLASLHFAGIDALAALLHDAGEFATGDNISPMKQLVPALKDVERHIKVVIDDKFGLHAADHKSIKFIDDCLLASEAKQLTESPEDAPYMQMPDLQVSCLCWTLERAEREFLARFNSLTEQMR